MMDDDKHKAFFLGENPQEQAVDKFSSDVFSAICSALEQGLGARLIVFMLMSHAMSLGYKSEVPINAVFHTILTAFIFELEKNTPPEYMKDLFPKQDEDSQEVKEKVSKYRKH